MTDDIVPTNGSAINPWDWTGAMAMAEQLCLSGLVPKAVQGKPQDALVILLTGRELRIGPMQSLRLINVIEGKAAMGAELIVALCVREPQVCSWFRCARSDGNAATYETLRVGNPEKVSLTFTMQQAAKAGLAAKQNWQRWPDAMLRARAASALARAVYPDLVGGLYDPDELEEEIANRWTPPAAPQAAPAEPEQPAPTRTEQVKAKVQQRVQEAATTALDATTVAVFGGPMFKGKPLAEFNEAQLERLLQLGGDNLAAAAKQKPEPAWAGAVRTNMEQIRILLAAMAAPPSAQPPEDAQWEAIPPLDVPETQREPGQEG